MHSRPRQDQSGRKTGLRAAMAGTTFLIAGLLACAPANAHPHVFIDGGVDFRIDASSMQEALEVTWLYDEFETLYILAAQDIPLNAQGELSETSRLTLVDRLSLWPEDFDGSAHLSIAGETHELNWPENLDAQLIDGRLQITFTRRLSVPIPLTTTPIEVGFFEKSYFFDFSVTNTPQIIGEASGCTTQVIPFAPDSNDRAMLDVLAGLGREETPEQANVGALFADRIILQCE